jgi:hypothetical protein
MDASVDQVEGTATNPHMINLVAGIIHRACSPETQAMLATNFLCETQRLA